MAVNQSLTLTLVSQNIEENTSKVRVLWQSTQTGGSYNMTSRTAKYYLSQNGGQEEEHAISYVLPYQSAVTLLDTTVTVSHDHSGNGSLSVRTWMNTNISAGVVTLSKTLTLPQIPRASTLSAADGIIGRRTRIAISKKSSAFTHSIAYRFGSLSGYITADGGTSATERVFSGDSIDFLLPESFYNAIPSSAAGECSLTLRTYHGGSLIGQMQTAAFTVGTDGAVCGPSVAGAVIDSSEITSQLTGNGALVRYHSKADCTITATAKKGATITEKRIAGVLVGGDRLVIDGVQTGELVFYAKDSRGYEARQTVSVSMIDYIRLTNNAAAVRTDPTSGKATLTLEGACFAGSFGAAENEITAAYQIDGGEPIPVALSCSGSRYRAVVELTDMDYERSYTLTVTVRDKLETAQKTLILPKGLPVFDWGEGDFAFHVPVSMDTPLGLAMGGTGRKSWDAGVVLSDGKQLTAAAGNGAFYGEENSLRFGVLPVSMGGTGASTPENARNAIGAAPATLTGSQFWVETPELLETRMKEVYAAMADGSSRYVLGIVNGKVYDIRLWRANASYGTAKIDSYDTNARRIRIITGGVWQPWEYPDPPMYLGTEYRTTARWQGKPVYTKLVDFGVLPNAGTRSVAHGCSAARILRAEGQASNGQAFPICGGGFYNISLRVGLTSIDIDTDYNYSDCTATVQLWYTKE